MILKNSESFDFVPLLNMNVKVAKIERGLTHSRLRSCSVTVIGGNERITVIRPFMP